MSLHIAGRINCSQVPPLLKLHVAKAELTGEARFDDDFSQILDDLVEQYHAEFPPPNIQAADELYISLRAEMRERQYE